MSVEATNRKFLAEAERMDEEDAQDSRALDEIGKLSLSADEQKALIGKHSDGRFDTAKVITRAKAHLLAQVDGALDFGECLLLLKEKCSHGEFQDASKVFGLRGRMIRNYMMIARAYYGADRTQLAGQPVRKMLAFERVYDQAAIEKASKEGTLKGLLAKSTVDDLLKQARALKAQNEQLAKDKTALQDELADLRHTRVKTKVTKLDLIVLDIVGAINAGTAYAKKHMDDADFVKEVAEKLTDINERLDNAIEGFKSALEGEGD